ncbi:hypothetical protein A2379_01055 [Candidatus Amesbacteria bacterium RIFOXYB1_FULL_47_13]|nr:MAG: hypothetical protein UX46_C0008G0037 [Candidatus Amesbacteria bacterium GW2011_GWC1_46_24]OGD05531.1 MAG: hypothetical protein A2379_01055 [Candidatus Amesbacteria bacterium RIFOXYB1_FULL_47_13]HBC73049.1 hypothetical protein [Candidatus Amesbacteria bacterium]
MAVITLDTSPREMLRQVAKAREVVAGESHTRKLIDGSLAILHDTVVTLYLEKTHLIQLMMMTERDKPNANKALIKQFLNNWGKALTEAQNYVEQFILTRWNSRIFRYRGRLMDARGQYAAAVGLYKKSLQGVKLDPEYIDRRVPRWLEIEAFIAYSTLASGKTKKGLELSEKIYKKFDLSEGLELKKDDYATWAIWKSGIAIRVGQAYMAKKFDMDMDKYKKWLAEAEKLFTPPPGVIVWVDFGFRKNEIAAIRRELNL